MYNVKTLMISAIVICVLILGGLYYSDRRSQSAYAEWAQEQNRILNESQKAAEAENPKRVRSDSAAEAQETEASETSPASGESDDEEAKAAETRKYHTTAGVNVRSSASPDGEKIGVLEKGDVLEDPTAEGDWFRIRYKGKEGYVSARYVSDEEE